MMEDVDMLEADISSGCVTLEFETGWGSPRTYTEDGIRVTSLYGNGSGHLHLEGHTLMNHSDCCSTPYEFTSMDGAPFTVKSLQVTSIWRWYGSPDTMFSPAGGNVSLNSTGTINFPASGWSNITSFRWHTSSGQTSIDNLVICAANTPPVADAGPNQTVECSGGPTQVTLDGSGSSDADDDALSYTWTGPFGTASGVSPTVSLPLGTHTITLTVTDSNGASDSDTVSVTVVDTMPPEVDINLFVSTLWPPNHKMHRVATIAAYDDCDQAPALAIEVTSNEPGNSTGDGNTASDWMLMDNGDGTYDVWVRAERKGNGGGRVYTITATATDASGNSATDTAEVTVAHDQR